MLHIKSLSKTYGQYTALDQINMHLAKGSIHGLIGKNGAGKTTLLSILSGAYKPTSGQMTFTDETLTSPETRRTACYFMPDLLKFNGQDYLHTLASLHESLYPNWSSERYNKLITGFKLNPKASLSRLSKGELRQAMFCLALSTMPSLLILDEPFDGLDPLVRHQVKNLLIQEVAQREVSILISSHNLNELDDLCDTLTLIHEGKILLSNDLDTLKQSLHKIQVVFKYDEVLLEQSFSILHSEQRGRMNLYVLRGNEQMITEHIQSLQPLFFERLPLTLEEVFIYEMEGQNGDYQNILL